MRACRLVFETDDDMNRLFCWTLEHQEANLLRFARYLIPGKLFFCALKKSCTYGVWSVSTPAHTTENTDVDQWAYAAPCYTHELNPQPHAPRVTYATALISAKQMRRFTHLQAATRRPLAGIICGPPQDDVYLSTLCFPPRPPERCHSRRSRPPIATATLSPT